MKKKIIITLSIIALIGIITIILISLNSNTTGNVVMIKEPIKIGAILPLTGKAAEFGQYWREGLELAVNDINNHMQVTDRRIELIVEDSASDPKIALNAYKKLKDTDNIKYLFLAISGVTMTILPESTKDNILVMTTSTHPEITSGKYLALRTYYTPEEEVKSMINFAYNTLEKRKIGIIYMNDESCRGYKEYFEKEFKILGGEAYSESFEVTEKDFKTQLTKIKEKKIGRSIHMRMAREWHNNEECKRVGS